MVTQHDEAQRRHWAAGALEHLTRLTSSVAAIRQAVESGSPNEIETQEELGSEVARAAAALTAWLDASRAPRGLGKAEGELAATAGVYRNVAVAYGSLGDAGSGQSAARFAACVKLLDQGSHHVELFDQLLRKKLQAA
jgi:hypothetical protein